MRSELFGTPKRAIFLSTFTRSTLLEECIKSILSAQDRERYIFFLIQQGRNEENSRIIEKYLSQIDYVFSFEGKYESAIKNINYNRVKGYQIAFGRLNCDYAVAVEDDVEISRDALVFVDEMMAKFARHRNFGCVNLLSLGNPNELEEGFSIYRSPLIGQGSAINTKLWGAFIKNGVMGRIDSEPFDGAVEDLVKCKFSIFPNRSRILDKGWEGTHSTNENDSYFVLNKQSWVSSPQVVHGYKHIQCDLNLRKDWVSYKRRNNMYYLLRKVVLDLNRTKYGNILVRELRKFLKLPSI